MSEAAVLEAFPRRPIERSGRKAKSVSIRNGIIFFLLLCLPAAWLDDTNWFGRATSEPIWWRAACRGHSANRRGVHEQTGPLEGRTPRLLA